MAYAITTWHWTPDTWNHEYNLITYKHFIKSNNKIQIISENEWVDLNLTSPTQADFDKYGMKDLSLMTTPSTTYNKSLQLDRTEGTGKLYKTTIDATKFNKQIQQIKSI